MSRKITRADFLKDAELKKRLKEGRRVAKALDEKTPLPSHSLSVTTTISLVDFVSELSPERVKLVRLTMKKEYSISELAVALKRNQSAVSKDVSRLKKLGLVTVEEVANQGHGRKKIVRAIAESICIQTVLEN